MRYAPAVLLLSVSAFGACLVMEFPTISTFLLLPIGSETAGIRSHTVDLLPALYLQILSFHTPFYPIFLVHYHS